jgi:hypothetical protein
MALGITRDEVNPTALAVHRSLVSIVLVDPTLSGNNVVVIAAAPK